MKKRQQLGMGMTLLALLLAGSVRAGLMLQWAPSPGTDGQHIVYEVWQSPNLADWSLLGTTLGTNLSLKVIPGERFYRVRALDKHTGLYSVDW